MSKKVISIIIPTYNEERNIKRTLKALCNQTLDRKLYEVIVVDGKSEDATVGIAKKFADKIILQNSDGIAAARNEGAANAEGKIIVTTDADTIPPRDWLEHILNDLKKPDIVAVSGPLLPYDATLFGRTLFRLGYNIQPRLFKPFFVFLFGPNTAIKKWAFVKCGGYRNLPVADDVEIFFRLKHLGKIVFDKNLKMYVSYRRFREIGPFKLTLFYNWINFNYFILQNIFDVHYARFEYERDNMSIQHPIKEEQNNIM